MGDKYKYNQSRPWRSVSQWRNMPTNRKNMQQRTVKKLGYYKGGTMCECGLSPEDTKHMLQYPLLAQPCSVDDLLVQLNSEELRGTLETSSLMIRTNKR